MSTDPKTHAAGPDTPPHGAVDFTSCKGCKVGHAEPRYDIAGRFTIYRCESCGLHYIDHLDGPSADSTVDMDEQELEKYFEYIRASMNGKRERFAGYADIVARAVDLEGARCLDIGAGSGAFLNELKERGAVVHGVEPIHARRLYAEQTFGITLDPEPFNAPDWYEGDEDSFDLITMWDVIEHVNYPIETLDAAYDLLAPGGVLALHTPIEDGIFHTVGQWTYKLSSGRYPTFLAALYSDLEFSHKQIMHSDYLRYWAVYRGGEIVLHETFHELSRPPVHYLRKWIRSDRLARIAAMPVSAALRAGPMHNKALMLVRKPER